MENLRDRLTGLRRQSGSVTKASEPNDFPEAAQQSAPPLRQRLRQLATPRTASTYRRTRLSESEVAALVDGELVADGLILTEGFFPFGALHGDITLEGDLADALALFGQETENHDDAVVFMDTETTGLAGGTGTLVFLLGLGRLTPDGLRIHQYLLTGFTGEVAMLNIAGEFLDGASTLVTFNGKSFDSPLLASRYRLAGIPNPFEALQHVDLLHPTRRAFAGRWENCRLQTAERNLLGFTRANDLPGAEAPEAWFHWVRLGVSERLPALIEHNRWDVVSLSALLQALHEAYQNPAQHSANTLAIARHRTRLSGDDLHTQLLANRAHLDTPGLLELARAHRRKGDWKQATRLWHQIAEQDHPEALERLAKYYEHVARDMEAALSFTERLQRLRPSDPDHRRRSRRLQQKVAAHSTAQGLIDRLKLSMQ